MDQSAILLFFSILEIPVYMLVSAVAFVAAYKLRGGIFGGGMKFIALGMLVSAVANFYFFSQGLPGVGFFTLFWGPIGDGILLVAYPVVTLLFFLIGFMKFIRVPKFKKKN